MGVGEVSGHDAEHDWSGRLRSAGLRMTQPRRRVLKALERQGHATPEELGAALAADGEATLPASTVYRNLESLAEAGLVNHSHVHHGAPTYHLPQHGDHLHLVCRQCGAVIEADPELARDVGRNLHRAHGFDADVTHMAIHGRCRSCSDTPPASMTTPKPTEEDR